MAAKPKLDPRDVSGEEKIAAAMVNTFSGSFAMEVRNATLIEKGELTDRVKVALLTGSSYEGLKDVVGIGREAAASHAFLTTSGCSYVPSIAFEGQRARRADLIVRLPTAWRIRKRT